MMRRLRGNVPAVLLLAEAVEGTGGPFSCSWPSPAAPPGWNATLILAAKVIVVQSAARDEVEVSPRDFMKAGVPVTMVTLVVSTLLLSFLLPF